jgi:hypothetical protein
MANISSPDLIGKAIEETNAQVTRIGLTFLGTTAFCLLSLFTPDAALLGGSKKIDLPLAGPVSFFGFMLLGPAVLIMLRVYLQIYVEHSNRLEQLGRSMLIVRAPTLVVPLKNPLMRALSGLTFYLVLPTAMIFFARKAAVFPDWGSGLLCVAVGVVVSHAMLIVRAPTLKNSLMRVLSGLTFYLVLPMAMIVIALNAAPLPHGGSGLLYIAVGLIASLSMLIERPSTLVPLKNPLMRVLGGLTLLVLALAMGLFSWRAAAFLDWRFLLCVAVGGVAGHAISQLKVSWRSNALLSVSAAIIALGVMFVWPLSRPFDLAREDLSNQWLQGQYLSYANLHSANLSGANLRWANLSDAGLFHATLNSADLLGANLSRASLHDARLKGASLFTASLSSALLVGADLSDADLYRANLSRANLRWANLSGADLRDADLRGSDLSHANLRTARLTQTELAGACGDDNTKLPENLEVRACSAELLSRKEDACL